MAPSENGTTTDQAEGTPPGLVSAVWRGPYVADMGPGQPDIRPGDSWNVVPEQALSEHWECDPTEVEAAQEYQDKLVQEQADAITQAEAEAAQVEAEGGDVAREVEPATPSPPPPGNSGSPSAVSGSGSPPAAAIPSAPVSGKGS